MKVGHWQTRLKGLGKIWKRGAARCALLGGINEDGVREIVVDGCPPDRVLCCANDYVQGGPAILNKMGGAICKI